MGNKQESDSIAVFTAKFPYQGLCTAWHNGRAVMAFSIKSCPGGQQCEPRHKPELREISLMEVPVLVRLCVICLGVQNKRNPVHY